MDLIKKAFPVSLRATDTVGLIISIVIYLILPVVLGIISSLTSGIPVLGWLVGVIVSIAGLYSTVGIVIAVLIFLKVIK